jgi:hypothetical protein
MWIVMIVSGLLADLLRTKHILSTTNVRKLFNAAGKIDKGVHPAWANLSLKMDAPED